jgi:hypothetical protein
LDLLVLGSSNSPNADEIAHIIIQLFNWVWEFGIVIVFAAGNDALEGRTLKSDFPTNLLYIDQLPEFASNLIVAGSCDDLGYASLFSTQPPLAGGRLNDIIYAVGEHIDVLVGALPQSLDDPSLPIPVTVSGTSYAAPQIVSFVERSFQIPRLPCFSSCVSQQ